MDEINKRVMEIISRYNLSKSAFATKLRVSPPVITHISTGRNKVGLDVVQRILQAYPDVSADWLLLGKGEMIQDEEIKARQRFKTDLDDLETRIRAVYHEVTVALNTLDKVRNNI